MPANVLTHKRTPLKFINDNSPDNSTPQMNFLFHSSRPLNSIWVLGSENISWVCGPDVRVRIKKTQEDTHVLMVTHNRNQERTSYIINVHQQNISRGSNWLLYSLLQTLSSCLYYLSHIYTYTHTHNKKY